MRSNPIAVELKAPKVETIISALKLFPKAGDILITNGDGEICELNIKIFSVPSDNYINREVFFEIEEGEPWTTSEDKDLD